jgi:uncharacterized protein (TIGR00369 family)
MSEMRSRTYQWLDPDVSATLGGETTALERFQAVARGDQPSRNPIQATIGWTIERVEAGFCRLRLEPRDFLFHAGGVLHGGVISTLLDSAMATAVLTTLPKSRHCTTLQLSVNTMRGIKPGVAVLYAEGRADHVASKAASASGVLLDDAGKVYAKAMTTCVVYDLPSRAETG